MQRRRVEDPLSGAPWAAARDKVELARALRKRLTPSERRLWAELRRERLGFRFRRQHVIAGFVVDFYCAESFLAVEVDGGIHDGRGIYDRERDAHLATLGLTVLRFSVDQVNGELPEVLRMIATSCTQRSPLPPQRGKGSGEGGTRSSRSDTDPSEPPR